MKNTYIIRKVCFFNNDLENVNVGLGDVVGVFDEYNQAYQSYLSCERYQHQRCYLSSFEIEQPKAKGLLKNMQHFFDKYFPQKNNFEDITKIPPLPLEATLKQTEEFIKLSGLKHYDLSIHEQMPTYFRIKMADNFWGNEEELPFTIFSYEVSSLYFLHETKEIAINEAINIGFSYLWSDMLEETNYDFMGFKGKLVDLSKTPDNLETYLQSCQNFWYDEEHQKIRFSAEIEENAEIILKELKNLFPLLILKPFEIIQIDLESMKNKPVLHDDHIQY